MQILIEIPNPPKRQEIVDVPLHFIDGDVFEAGGYGFKVLSPHGRLIDADEIPYTDLNDDPKSKVRVYVAFKERIDRCPTILEAEE